MKDSVLQILEKLISFRSINSDYDANHEAIEYVDRFLSECGMHVMRYEFDGVESLVATTKRTKTPTVMLCGHLDVVSADDDLFTMKRQDGKLIGRGMMDMKAAVAAYLQVIYDLQDHLAEYDFGIMITTDEEKGSGHGAPLLIAEGYLPKMCVIPDGSRDWALESLAKGHWLIDIETVGKSAHGSRPWEGESAIEKMIRLLEKVKLAFPSMQDWETSTITIAQFMGGNAINQVPSSAKASLDIRFASLEDEKNIKKALMALFEANNASIIREVSGSPCIHNLNNPYLVSFAASLEKVIGYPTGTAISGGGSEALFFTGRGIPCAVFYPTGGGHHGPKEWISEEACQQMQMIFRDYLEKEAKLQNIGMHGLIPDTAKREIIPAERHL